MSIPVNVFISEAELAEGRETKRTTCLKVDPDILHPVTCVSRPGISSGTLFTRSERQQTGRYLNDKEMTAMYDKFVGSNSLINAAVRMEKEESKAAAQVSPPGSTLDIGKGSRATNVESSDRTRPVLPARIAVAMAAAGCDNPYHVTPPVLDERAREQAANAAAMKYVAPHIARKYGINQGISPAGPRAAAAVASHRSSGRGGGGAAAALQSGDNPSSTGSSIAGDGWPPRPSSAAFKTTSRSHAQRHGSHFLYGGPSNVPPPGKYDPKYAAMDKACPGTSFSRPGQGQAGNGTEPGGAAGAVSGATNRRNRPGSAPATAGGSRGNGSGRPSSAPSHRPPDDGTDTSAPHDAQAASTAMHAQSGMAAPPAVEVRRGISLADSSPGTAATRLTAEARAQLVHRHEDLFIAAHRVHPQRPTGPRGSFSFKATERKPLHDAQPPGSQLFGEYYREGYDKFIRKASRPSSAFITQPQRQYSNGPLGETGPTVGPGTYSKVLPGTNTGRHVPSGHSNLSRTPDWNCTTPRPASAPAVRPPPSSASHQGYWGPEGPVTSMFPDEPEYDELNSIRMLQAHTSRRPMSGLPPRAPTHTTQQQAGRASVARAAGGGSARGSTAGQSQSQAFTAAVVASAEDPRGAGSGSGGGNGSGATGRLVYVGPERYGELTSAGLAKRVYGGAFPTASREVVCQTMRAISNPRITPPAAVRIKPSTDLVYDYDMAVEGHRGRKPAWGLPPNRNALSQQWMEAAATAYMS